MSLYEGGILIYWLTHYVARAQSSLALVWALHTGSDRHASQTLYDVSIFENEEHCFNHHLNVLHVHIVPAAKPMSSHMLASVSYEVIIQGTSSYIYP